MPRAPRTPAAAAAAALMAPAERRFPQARARATYQAIVEAARAVFAERGYDAAQTPEIAARAGVSVGTFYRYFVDKRQALVEMLRVHLAETSARVLSEITPDRFEHADHRAIVDGAIEALFAEARRFPALERVLQEMALRDPEVAALRDAFEATSEEALAALISGLTSRADIPDPRAAAHVIQRAGLLIAIAEAGGGTAVVGRARRVGEGAVKVALREMILRYLFPGGTAPAGAAGSSRAKATGPSSPRKMRPPWASTTRRQK